MMMHTSRQNVIIPIAVPLLFVLIYFPVFYSDYAYLDEIHQLWYNQDDTNFRLYHTQGRWLSGLLFQELFPSISTIDQLKYLRMISLFGWIATGLLWFTVLRKWITLLQLPVELLWIGSVYVVCSISVSVYIGWAVCLQIFLGIMAGLMGGHILFTSLMQSNRRMPVMAVFFSVLLGGISLFLYPTSFGMALLPFFLNYMQKKAARPDRILVYGIAVHLFTYIVYYFLFKASLAYYAIEASNRTHINFDFFSKLSFFFAGPLPQGFSMNLLFSARSIFSQLFYPAMIILWLVSVFKRNRQTPVIPKLIFIAVILFLSALVYLPVMIAQEDFPSYRTLFAFNLAIFLLVTDAVLFLVRDSRKRTWFSVFAVFWLVASSVYAFHFQFVYPLRDEYRTFRSFMESRYRPSINKVLFVRADKFSFTPRYNTMVYRDEFGAPSTYRDWVPEPITRQVVFEITGSRDKASALHIVQFENIDSFHVARPVIDNNTLLINMNDISKNN